MPYPERIRRTEIEKTEKCVVCLEPAPKGEVLEVHSATSLHLELSEVKGELRYVVTSTHQGHEQLKGKALNVGIYQPEGKPEQNDAFCLCVDCHQEVHRVALAKTRLTDKDAKIASPKVLMETTFFYVQIGRPLLEKSTGGENTVWKKQKREEVRKIVFSLDDLDFKFNQEVPKKISFKIKA